MKKILFKIRTTILLWKGGVAMNIYIDMYVSLIVAGRRKISQVPQNIRQQVIDDLAAIGLDENGKVEKNTVK